MSDQVQLSAYSEAIENLIRSEQYDQAIALCQHILCYYPKHIATYRQMAVANLEKGDVHSAGELFRRVLSANPEDYVAYAGLAAIFERQALFDEAVWHLERAFELSPGIPEIGKELLRLYGERDGRPRTRLKLTAGALARLYVREGLFAQAIQEFKGILLGAPRRFDVRLALAETMWHAGQMRDSTQVCQEILQALPHCLKANLILGKALQESGADTAGPYLECAQALDPTNRMAQEIFGEQSPLGAANVLIPPYVERAAPTPAAETAPIATEQALAQEEGFEDWFAETHAESLGPGQSGGFGAPSDSPVEGEATAQPAAPFEQWSPMPEVQAQEPPAWVSQMSVPSEPVESPAAETLPWNQVPSTAEEPSPETPPQSSTPQTEPPPWLLSDFGLAAPLSAAPSPAAPSPAASESTVPAFSSLPPWLTELRNTAEVDRSTEPATEEGKQETSEPLPEWTVEPFEAGETAATPPAAEEKASTSESWLSWQAFPPRGTEAGRSAEQTESADELVGEQAVLTQEPVETGTPGEPAPFEIRTAPAGEEQSQDDLPDWLRMTRVQDAAEGTGLPPASEEEPGSQIPDWLRTTRVPDAAEGTGLPASEEEPDSQLPDWLRTTRVQDAAEGTGLPPVSEEEQGSQFSDWLQTTRAQDAAEGMDMAPPGTEEKPGAKVPDRFGATRAQDAAESAGLPPASEVEPGSQLPDWFEPTRVQDAAEDMGMSPPGTEEKPGAKIPDWLQGLQVIPQETAFPSDEGRSVGEAREQEEQPPATVGLRGELESKVEAEPEAVPPWLQEEPAVEGGLAVEKDISVQESELPESGAWATETQVEPPAEVQPAGESETIVLYEEAADRELYGDQVVPAAPEAQESVEELAGEAESVSPAPEAAASVEVSAPEETPPAESLRRRRDPKGYSQLVQARAHCQDNRLGEALKEYDYLVQHSPRLVNAVIEDLEELVRRLDVPLEAHRILGDAYTRADRLADALERYRFVLERVS